MPPKGKAQEKKVKKIVEDKTFGLKNKNKSKKVQQYISNVSKAAEFVGKTPKQVKQEELERKARQDAKKAAEMAKAETESLFKTVVKAQVVPAGADPKSVLCEFYRAGKCVRGNKCKYSHDVDAVRKVAKMDIYTDPRSLDTMDNWDQSKLESVVNEKAKGKLPPTEIICKYFLDAIEQNKYGWFWECPNGKECHYRHALPPGFVLKSKPKEGDLQDEEEQPDIGELIEDQRKKLDLSKCTPVTIKNFTEWKEKQIKKKQDEVEAKRKDAAKKSGGSGLHIMSGRDLFRYDPTLFVDDEAADDEKYEIQENDGENVLDDTRPTWEREGVDLDTQQAEEEEEDQDGRGGGEGDGEGEDEEGEEEGEDGDAEEDGEEGDEDEQHHSSSAVSGSSSGSSCSSSSSSSGSSSSGNRGSTSSSGSSSAIPSSSSAVGKGQGKGKNKSPATQPQKGAGAGAGGSGAGIGAGAGVGAINADLFLDEDLPDD